jgi:hypothetical protein
MICRRLPSALHEILRLIFRRQFLPSPSYSVLHPDLLFPLSLLVTLNFSSSNLSRFPRNLSVFPFDYTPYFFTFTFIPVTFALPYSEFKNTGVNVCVYVCMYVLVSFYLFSMLHYNRVILHAELYILALYIV